MSDLCVRTCDSLGSYGELLAMAIVGGRWIWAEIKRREIAKTAVRLESEKVGLQATVQALSQRPSPLRMGAPPVDLLGLAPAPRPSTATQTDETAVSADATELADRSTDQRK